MARVNRREVLAEGEIQVKLSVQEQAIVDGKKVLHGAVTDRVLRMFDAIYIYGSPWIIILLVFGVTGGVGLVPKIAAAQTTRDLQLWP